MTAGTSLLAPQATLSEWHLYHTGTPNPKELPAEEAKLEQEMYNIIALLIRGLV